MNRLPVKELKKLEKIGLKIKRDSLDPKERWESSVLLDKSLLHNLYLNVVSGKYGTSEEGFNIEKMITSLSSAFSPAQKNKLREMIKETDDDWTTSLINGLFKTYKGVLQTRSFRIDPKYLKIKKAIYFQRHQGKVVKK